MPVPANITDLSPNASSNSPPGSEAIGSNLDDYLRTAFAFIRQAGSPGITGLTGASDATTPATKFTLSADSVSLQDSVGKTRTYLSVGPVTVDISLASSLGGRDQAGAFAAGAEVNLFFVPNGSGGLGLVASLAGVNAGPTGYAEWAIAANLKLNGGAQINKGRIAGDEYFFGTAQPMASGIVTAFPTAASHSAIVPSLATKVTVSYFSIASAGSNSDGNIIQGMSSNSTTILFGPTIYVNAGKQCSSNLNVEMPTTSTGLIYIGYQNATPSISSLIQYLNLSSYTMRNGAR